ncbi:MAG: cytochrome c biogenesis protein CcsA [Phycisphaerae bacterium]|nr:cytochrome c biogenesis protein CcsA [Phycisphaerae bacterium]
MKNLYEVFITLAMLLPVVTLISKKILNVSYEALDMFWAFLILIPPGFIGGTFSEHSAPLRPALQTWLFAPHIGAYMLSYVIMFKSAGPACKGLFVSKENCKKTQRDLYCLVSFGFPLLTLGLLLGACWGQKAWGSYWNWDPKELWSLASWLMFLVYFHVRYMNGLKYHRITSLLALLGTVLVIITLLYANLSKLFPGLHSYA